MMTSSIQKHFSRLNSLLEDVESACVNAAEEYDELEAANNALQEAVDTARQYYEASQNEIRFLLEFSIAHGLSIPLDAHFLDINPLVPDGDAQKGEYDYPIEAVNLDSFCWIP